MSYFTNSAKNSATNDATSTVINSAIRATMNDVMSYVSHIATSAPMSTAASKKHLQATTASILNTMSSAPVYVPYTFSAITASMHFISLMVLFF